MISKHDKAREQLDRLGSTLARDVDELSDEALFREAEEGFGDPTKAGAETRRLIDATIATYGKRRLAAARQGHDATGAGRGHSKVVALAPRKKRALIERFAGDNRALREKLTMAARREEDHSVDIDSFLEDLVELGVIDEEGNVL